MKIETKFNIGDDIFYLIEEILYDENGEITTSQFTMKLDKINHINIEHFYFTKEPIVSYSFTNFDRVSETYCFKTLDEATKVLKEKQKL